MYDVVKISDREYDCCNGVGQWYTLLAIYYDRIPCCREVISDKYPQSSFRCLWKCYCREWSPVQTTDCISNKQFRVKGFESSDYFRFPGYPSQSLGRVGLIQARGKNLINYFLLIHTKILLWKDLLGVPITLLLPIFLQDISVTYCNPKQFT